LSELRKAARRLSAGRTCGPACVEEASCRMFLCARCRCQVLVCRRCDRGQIYCIGTCAQEARRDRQREARRRYQATARGRALHAARNRRYRARQLHHVTDHGLAKQREGPPQAWAVNAASGEPPSRRKSSGHAHCHHCGCVASAFLPESVPYAAVQAANQHFAPDIAKPREAASIAGMRGSAVRPDTPLPDRIHSWGARPDNLPMHIGGPAFRLSAAKKMRIYAAANTASNITNGKRNSCRRIALLLR